MLVSVLLALFATARADTIDSVISQWDLGTASYNLSFPATTLNSDAAARWVVERWNTIVPRLDWGDSDVVFSPDPSTSASTLVRRQSPSSSHTSSASLSSRSSSSRPLALSSQTSIASPASTNLAGQPPVLRIGYPAGSYSGRTGGTQFTSNFSAAVGGGASGASGTVPQAGFERVLLAYDVWFPTGFAFNKGAKLPGLRGGPDRTGCSGGSQTNGTSCFSTRLMWRDRGAGEVYAYIPPVSGLCNQDQVICNSDYGTSLGRGTFSFGTGQWQTIWLLVVLNDIGKANGMIELWYNSVPAMRFPQSVLRTTTGVSGITGLFFSTFFGGDDASWATPTQQYTYFRNIRLYGGSGASGAQGPAAPTGAVASDGSGQSGGGGQGGNGSGAQKLGPGWLVGRELAISAGIMCLVGTWVVSTGL